MIPLPALRPLYPTLFLSALLLCACVGTGGAAETSPHSITPERIEALPPAERGAWYEYYQRSAQLLQKEKEILAGELAATGLKTPLRPPGNSGFGGFSMARKKPADWFATAEARAMAEAAITYQTPSGGWSKGVEFNQGPRKPGMHWSLEPEKWYYVGTFDNGVFMGNMTALAKIATSTRDPASIAAFNKGLDYLFHAQFPNGGWPQNYPLAGWYHDEITFNDSAMIHNVSLLRDVAGKHPQYAFVDEVRRAQAERAMQAGLQCILKTQVRQDGKPTAWCAQHDPITLLPAMGRSFEVPSLSGWESADIVRFLMTEPSPSEQVIEAVEGAVAWFTAVKIQGYEVVPGINAAGGRTYTLKANPQAGPLWARFYELGTNRPIFVTRQSQIFYNLADLDQSGPGNGYNWYVTQPATLLTKDYPRWTAEVRRNGAK